MKRNSADALAEDALAKSIVVLKQDLRLSETGLTYHGGAASGRWRWNRKIPRSRRRSNSLTLPTRKTQRPIWAGLTVEAVRGDFHNVHFAVEAGYTPRADSWPASWSRGARWPSTIAPLPSRLRKRSLIARRNPYPDRVGGRLEHDVGTTRWYFATVISPAARRPCRSRAAPGWSRLIVLSGPHACLFHLWGQDKTKGPRKPSWFYATSPPRWLKGRSFGSTKRQLRAGACSTASSLVPNNASSLDRPDLIRQTGTAAPTGQI